MLGLQPNFQLNGQTKIKYAQEIQHQNKCSFSDYKEVYLPMHTFVQHSRKKMQCYLDCFTQLFKKIKTITLNQTK